MSENCYAGGGICKGAPCPVCGHGQIPPSPSVAPTEPDDCPEQNCQRGEHKGMHSAHYVLERDGVLHRIFDEWGDYDDLPKLVDDVLGPRLTPPRGE